MVTLHQLTLPPALLARGFWRYIWRLHGRGKRGSYLRRALIAGAIANMVAWTESCPLAQNNQGETNVFRDFSQHRDQTLLIEGTLSQMQAPDFVATYSGDLRIVLGETTMRCHSLTVYFVQENAAGDVRAKITGRGPFGVRDIWKIEAKGGVLVKYQDQVATGAVGIVDLRGNMASLSGNVIVSREQKVMRAGHLAVDLTTGVSRMEPNKVLRY